MQIKLEKNKKIKTWKIKLEKNKNTENMKNLTKLLKINRDM